MRSLLDASSTAEADIDYLAQSYAGGQDPSKAVATLDRQFFFVPLARP